MAENYENELKILAGYLDGLVGTVTSEWATESPENGNSGVSDIHNDLQQLLTESLELSKAVEKK
jgi:hypothetical protein